MRKMIFVSLFAFCAIGANAYQLQSQQELGIGEAKNQNVVVKCTTVDGKISDQTCNLRRQAKCAGKKCDGWKEWKDLRNPSKSYSDWRSAASDCCQAKDLR
jgi:hypothetical protein